MIEGTTKKITIFSTRFIALDDKKEDDKKKYLFSNTEKIFSRFLQDYYVRLDEIIDKLLEEESDINKNRLYILLKSHLVEFALGRSLEEGELEQLSIDGQLTNNVSNKGDNTGNDLNDLLTTFDKSELDEADEEFETIFETISDSIDVEIKSRKKPEIKERIEKWGIADRIKALGSEDDERFYLYQLPGEDIYAVLCPEDNKYKDSNEDRWIPCLLNCAHELAKNDGLLLDIRLVLHDKDLGEDNERYAGRFTYLSNEDVRNRNLDCGRLKEKDECKILFFLHTVGGIVDILLKIKEIEIKDIHKEVDNVMVYYEKLAKIKKDGENALNEPNGLTNCRQTLKNDINDLIEKI